jgi:uncharacterized protein
MRRPQMLSIAAAFMALALVAAACGNDPDSPSATAEDTIDEDTIDEADPIPSAEDSGDDETDDPVAVGDGTAVDEPTVAASFTTTAAAGQVTVTNAVPGTDLVLGGGPTSAGGTVDELGNLLFRNLEPGSGYVVRDPSAEPVAISDELIVPSFTDHPDPGFYEAQEIGDGYGYIEMRDGTLLAATVRLPGPIENGPYPTVIEYSGYDPASPYEVEPTIGIYGRLGWATVGVNMRGSGCSGGAFDFFEPIQSIDGYDVIEAIAAQDWVYRNQVGMVGISYSGISQLFVAATQPPSLAAITPISVIEDSYRSVVYPGGIYNNGFAKSWGDSRQGSNDAYGQAWVNRRIDEEGDTACDANQLLRSQNRDLEQAAAESAFYTAEAGDLLAPRTFVDRITVPTFIAGAWQDEQTGGRFSTMLDNFTTDVLKVQLYNGAHADSLGPESLIRATEFLDVYVADRIPRLDPLVRFGAPILYAEVFGVDGLIPPPDRFTSLDEARSVIESEPPFRVLLEMGANESALGGPLSRGEVLFETWPPPEAETFTWNLGPDGRLLETFDSTVSAVEQFTVDVDRSQELTKAAEDDDDGNEFDDLQWELLDDGAALVYETDTFRDDLLLVGSGLVSLDILTAAGDADLQVTISEVRPDGYEMYIQSGWLRASHRALDPAETTDTLPWQTHTEADVAPLRTDEFTTVQVELFPAAHVIRAGSRLRLIVDSPGGNRNLWAFDVLPNDGDTIQVDVGFGTDSFITLPFVRDLPLPAGLPDCENTRSQPCRMWIDYPNDSAG